MFDDRTLRAEAQLALEWLAGSMSRVSRLRTEFLGDSDPLDLLWWRANPLQPTVGGTVDPALEIHALRRSVYSRQKSVPPLVEVIDDDTGAQIFVRADEYALRNAELAANRNDRALDSALAALLIAPPTIPASETAQPLQSASLGQEPDDSAPTAEFASPVHGALRRFRWIIAAAVVTVAIAGLAISRESIVSGFTASSAAGSSSASSTPSAPLPRSSASPDANDPTRNSYADGTHFTRETSDLGNPDVPLAIFDVAQQPSDISPVDLGSDIVLSSERALFPVAGINAKPFAARTVTGRVCLSIVLADNSSSMACVANARYISDGIQLRLSSSLMVNFPQGTAGFQRVYYEFVWANDGSLSGSSNL